MRVDQLTFVRFLAALAILVFHFGHELFPFNQPALKAITNQLNLGVSFFFVLSGFVMMLAYYSRVMDQNARWNFYVRRIARIYPVYILGLFLMTGFYLAFGGTINITSFLLGVFSIQSWTPAHALSLNTPGWSICVEFAFYALFPLLLHFFKSLSANRALIITGFIWAGSQLLFLALFNSDSNQGMQSDLYRFLFYNPLLHLNQFMVGSACYLIYLKWRDRPSNRYLPLWLFSMSACIIFVLIKPDVVSYHNGLLAPLFGAFILFLALDRSAVSRSLAHPWLVYAGEISYTLYILQLPVHKVWMYACEKFLLTNPYLQFIGFIVLLIIVAVLSYEILEKRAKHFLIDKLGRSTKISSR